MNYNNNEDKQNIINNLIKQQSFGKEGIYYIIPQREPFLMVDYVLDIDLNKKQIVCSKTINENEWYFSGHFPNNPIMPGVLMIECMAQASSIISKIVIPSEDTFLLTSVENAKFKEICRPNDTLIIQAKIEKIKGNLMMSSCSIKTQKDIIVATCNISAFKKKILI